MILGHSQKLRPLAFRSTTQALRFGLNCTKRRFAGWAEPRVTPAKSPQKALDIKKPSKHTLSQPDSQFCEEEKEMRKFLASALPLAVFGLLATVSLSNAQVGGDPDFVPAGADLLKTLPGTFFVIGGIPVPLHGVPDATGADTIIQRLAAIGIPDVIGASQTINTQMTELNLMSNPGAGPGGTTVFIGLTQGVLSLGTLTLVQTINGEGIPEGTFSSFFDVFFDIRLQAGAQPVPCDTAGDIVCHSELTLTGSGLWTDDTPGGFLVGQVMEQHPGAGVHVANSNPEPGTFVLFGSGLVLAALTLKRP